MIFLVVQNLNAALLLVSVLTRAIDPFQEGHVNAI
jgi:hypothetical protein